MSEVSKHFNKGEQTKARIQQLTKENEDAENRLFELQRQQGPQEEAIRQHEARANELKQHLLELRATQEQVTEQAQALKQKQIEMRKQLDDRATKSIQIRQESDRLRPYSTQSPAALEGALRDLKDRFASDKATVEKLEKTVHALVRSANAFSTVTSDVKNLSHVLGEIETNLIKEEEEIAKAIRHRDALSERTNKVKELEHQERMLQRQLSSYVGSTENVRKGAKERNKQAQDRRTELTRLIAQLKEQKRERAVEIDRSRIRTEQVEQQVCSLSWISGGSEMHNPTNMLSPLCRYPI